MSADFNLLDLPNVQEAIRVTSTFQLQPGASYIVDISGNQGTATAVNVNYQKGDGTYHTYDDSPGSVTGAGFAIDVPASGIVQVELTGTPGAALVICSFARQVDRLG